MIVVYAMTENLYPHFRPTLRSLLEHNDPEKVYIFAETDELPYALPDVCEVINVSDQEFFKADGPNMNSQFTYMAMMRSLYAELLPCDRVIQLDIDTIVCDSLQPLWDMDLTGKWLGACQEYTSTHRPYGPKYYNIGVAVFNLEQIRKDKIVPEIVKAMNERHFDYLEQDAFNEFGLPENKIADIPVRFNDSFCCGRTDNPAVVHYAGYNKWYYTQDMPRVEYLNKYRK